MGQAGMDRTFLRRGGFHSSEPICLNQAVPPCLVPTESPCPAQQGQIKALPCLMWHAPQCPPVLCGPAKSAPLSCAACSPLLCSVLPCLVQRAPLSCGAWCTVPPVLCGPAKSAPLSCAACSPVLCGMVHSAPCLVQRAPLSCGAWCTVPPVLCLVRHSPQLLLHARARAPSVPATAIAKASGPKHHLSSSLVPSVLSSPSPSASACTGAQFNLVSLVSIAELVHQLPEYFLFSLLMMTCLDQHGQQLPSHAAVAATTKQPEAEALRQAAHLIVAKCACGTWACHSDKVQVLQRRGAAPICTSRSIQRGGAAT